MALTQIEHETLTVVKKTAKDFGKKLTTIDWEQRRYELVKDILPSLIQVNADTAMSEEAIINLAVNTADRVITLLKK